MPKGWVALSRWHSKAVKKRTVGQPFAACGGLVDAQPVRQELSCVNLRSPRQNALSG